MLWSCIIEEVYDQAYLGIKVCCIKSKNKWLKYNSVLWATGFIASGYIKGLSGFQESHHQTDELIHDPQNRMAVSGSVITQCLIISHKHYQCKSAM